MDIEMADGAQLARQWQLLRILEQFRFGISVDDIADRVECSRRTVERDLATLYEIGFPISCETRDIGKKFWHVEQNFLESDKLIVGPTEMISMHLAKQCMAPLSSTCFGEGLEQLWGKIKSLLPRKALNYFAGLDEKFYVKFFDVDSNPNETTNLESFRKAINNNQVVSVEYNPDRKSSGYKMEFHPYGLVLYEGSMYVIGYSVQAQALRTFKIKRLTSVETTKKTFKKPEDFSLERCVSSSFGIHYKEINRITVRCEFRDWAARLIREQKWHRTQVIEKDSGNKVVVSFLLDATTEFKKWILGFGPVVKVLEPKQLRNEMKDLLNKTLQNYCS
jgi:predicted DNA-binding transcriptional regulator YafY